MLLLQILDEGTITDSQGRKVDFRVRFYPNSLSHHFSFFIIEHHYLPHEQHWYARIC
jgi:hypothetical protein